MSFLTKQKISSFIDACLRFFFDPIFFIATLGPMFVGNNYFMTTKLNGHTDPLLDKGIENPYMYALISYNIQYFVMMVVFVFFVSETIIVTKPLWWDKSFKRLTEMTKHSIFSKLMFLSFFFIFGLFIYCHSKGTFPQIHLDLYLKSNEHKIFRWWEEPSWPPVESSITHFRIAFIVYAILLSIWKTKSLPQLLKKAST